MRYGQCDNQLHSEQGALGVAKISDLKQCHALMLRTATTNIIKEFCDPGCKMPHASTMRILQLSLNNFCFFKVETLSTIEEGVVDRQRLTGGMIFVMLVVIDWLRTPFPKMVQTICDKVECLTADAAADEQLALVF